MLFPWWIKYPNVNNEIQNLDWLEYTVKHLSEEVKNFINLNKIKYADPILWDITHQYEANTIVVDPQTGDAFISTKPVPYGVSLNNTNYWTKIYNYADAISKLEEQIAAANEGLSTTASAARSVGDLVWLNGLLYKVTAPMIAGDSYVVNSNVVKTTIENELDGLRNNINTLTTFTEQGLINERVARENADTTLQNNIDALTTFTEQGLENERIARENTDNELRALINPNYKRILTVGAYGCDYTTINDAVTQAKTYSTDTERTAILICGGVYNEEITLDGNGIDLIGLGHVTIQYGSTYPNAPLYVVGSIMCQNITFYNTSSSGNAYGVHYESQTDPSLEGADVRFIDCTFISVGASALGMGMGENMTARFKNCMFYCDSAAPIYFHNYPLGLQYGQYAEFYDCQLITSYSYSVLIDNARAIGGAAGVSNMAIVFNKCMAGVGKGSIVYRNGANTSKPYVPTTGEVFITLKSEQNDMPGLNYVGSAGYTITVPATLPQVPDSSDSKMKVFIPTPFDATMYYRRINSVMINGYNYTNVFSVGNVTSGGVVIETTEQSLKGYYGLFTLEFSLDSNFS